MKIRFAIFIYIPILYCNKEKHFTLTLNEILKVIFEILNNDSTIQCAKNGWWTKEM